MERLTAALASEDVTLVTALLEGNVTEETLDALKRVLEREDHPIAKVLSKQMGRIKHETQLYLYDEKIHQALDRIRQLIDHANPHRQAVGHQMLSQLLNTLPKELKWRALDQEIRRMMRGVNFGTIIEQGAVTTSDLDALGYNEIFVLFESGLADGDNEFLDAELL